MTPINRPSRIRFNKRNSIARLFRKIDIESDEKKRSELIDKLAKIPMCVTSALAKHNGGKCWYCERKLPRSELVVEHFRPKRRVTGFPTHRGYWWLAANSTNFRIACKNCNCRWTNPDGIVGGKGNYFPLIDESARGNSRHSNLNAETPLLYDPLVQSDCFGLIFNEDGVCYPASSDYIEVNRAYSSITIYNLNNPHLVDSRKMLWGDISLKAEIAIALKGKEPELYQKVINFIRSQTKDQAVFSGLARCAVFQLNQSLNVGI